MASWLTNTRPLPPNPMSAAGEHYASQITPPAVAHVNAMSAAGDHYASQITPPAAAHVNAMSQSYPWCNSSFFQCKELRKNFSEFKNKAATFVLAHRWALTAYVIALVMVILLCTAFNFDRDIRIAIAGTAGALHLLGAALYFEPAPEFDPSQPLARAYSPPPTNTWRDRFDRNDFVESPKAKRTPSRRKDDVKGDIPDGNYVPKPLPLVPKGPLS